MFLFKLSFQSSFLLQHQTSTTSLLVVWLLDVLLFMDWSVFAVEHLNCVFLICCACSLVRQWTVLSNKVSLVEVTTYFRMFNVKYSRYGFIDCHLIKLEFGRKETEQQRNTKEWKNRLVRKKEVERDGENESGTTCAAAASPWRTKDWPELPW